MDVHDKTTRSRNMKAIKSRDTKPEMIVRRLLHNNGFRYRVAPENLPGKPDLWLAKWNTAIFVNGCFWHMHSCERFRLPDTRKEFWLQKLGVNKKRDQEKNNQLLVSGKRVLIIWECSLLGKEKLPHAMILSLIKTFLFSDSPEAEINGSGLIITLQNAALRT
ncbi:DNA mismatch endonuclease Vsr [Vibrio fluvialis]|nr:DNA mismatch endonuclease Vsr [Vibrio fluvialis]